jgi:ribosomal protein L29
MTDQTPADQGQLTQQSNFSIPEEYADRGWAEKIKSPDDLWKSYDNAQSLLGKRPAGVPQPDAPDEEWDKFYAAAGRPESPDKYALSDIQGVPEGTDLTPFKQKASSILHAAGLNQKQADRVWQQYIQEELKTAGESKASYEARTKELDAEFDKLTKEHFGDKFDQANASALEMAKNLPEQFRSVIAEAQPKEQVALIAALNYAKGEIDKVKAEYGKEGSLSSGGGVTPQNIEETRKELATLRTSQAAKDFLHADHKTTMARINELSGSVALYYKNSA